MDWVLINKLFYKLTKEQIEALTCWAEARGELVAGQQAVISVIRNRVRIGGWFVDKRIAAQSTATHGVCLKKWQFSCYLPNDPNRMLLEGIANDWKAGLLRHTRLQSIEALANNPELEDNTEGASYYFNPKIVMPNWASKFMKTASIGNHDFYRP